MSLFLPSSQHATLEKSFRLTRPLRAPRSRASSRALSLTQRFLRAEANRPWNPSSKRRSGRCAGGFMSGRALLFKTTPTPAATATRATRAKTRVLKHSRSSTLPPRVPAACHGHRVAAAAACCALGHVSCARARAHDDSESRPEAAVACMAAKAAAQTALAVTAATTVRRDGTRLIVK